MNDFNSNNAEEKPISLILAFDTNDNKKDEGSSPWMALNMPFVGGCCLKILNMNLEYSGNSPDKMAGFFGIKQSKRFTTRPNQRGNFEIIVNGTIKKNPSVVQVPLCMAGTESPKVTIPIPLEIHMNEQEIKFCILDNKRNPVPLKRGVFIFEIIKK